MSRTWTFHRVAAALALAAAVGCNAGMAPTDSEQALRDRVEGYWKLKAGRDVVKMYEYLDQSYRDKTSLADYVQSVNRDLKYFEFKIDSIDRQNDRATVVMSYTWQLPDYALMGLKPQPKLSAGVPEVWKLEGGVWNRTFQESAAAVARSSKPAPPAAPKKAEGGAGK